MKDQQLSFEGQTIFAGIDVHKKQWKVTILSENTYCKTFSQNPDPILLDSYLREHYPNASYKTAYEAGFCGFWIHHKLEELKIDSMVVDPSDIPTTDKEKKQKEDLRDSRKIAVNLRSNQLQRIYTPSVEELEDRSLIRLRCKLVQDRTRYKNRITSFLDFHGIHTPVEFEHRWTTLFIEWLRSLDLDRPSGRQALDGMLTSYLNCNGQIKNTMRAIRALSKTYKYERNVILLRSIPGVGLLSAMLILAEIMDIARFKKAEQLCSFIGLIPTTNSSGENNRQGNMTKRSNKNVKTYIIEASWVAVRKDPAMTYAFNKYCQKMEKNKAIIRIAKRLTNRIKHILEHQKAYQSGLVQ